MGQGERVAARRKGLKHYTQFDADLASLDFILGAHTGMLSYNYDIHCSMESCDIVRVVIAVNNKI